MKRAGASRSTGPRKSARLAGLPPSTTTMISKAIQTTPAKATTPRTPLAPKKPGGTWSVSVRMGRDSFLRQVTDGPSKPHWTFWMILRMAVGDTSKQQPFCEYRGKGVFTMGFRSRYTPVQHRPPSPPLIDLCSDSEDEEEGVYYTQHAGGTPAHSSDEEDASSTTLGSQDTDDSDDEDPFYLPGVRPNCPSL